MIQTVNFVVNFLVFILDMIVSTSLFYILFSNSFSIIENGHLILFFYKMLQKGMRPEDR